MEFLCCRLQCQAARENAGQSSFLVYFPGNCHSLYHSGDFWSGPDNCFQKRKRRRAAGRSCAAIGFFRLLPAGYSPMSIIANNIPNAYSIVLSMQVLSKTCQRVGRITWTLFGAVFYMLIAIPAVSDFNNTLNDFLLIIAYWLGPWSIILIEEHFLIRRGRYNVDDWDTKERLPIGWAALVALGFGMLGIYLGAAQTLFVGPIARLFNPPYGMDIGFELGLIFAGIAYPFLRRFELSIHRR